MAAGTESSSEGVITTEINNDEDADNVVTVATSDLSDVSDAIEEKDYQEAVDKLDEVIADLQAARVFLETQVK